ncbi:MAG: hypothetical protein ACI9F9_000800 [Candidatus Paceibacteria bacterium]|jgi:hypothetical protein
MGANEKQPNWVVRRGIPAEGGLLIEPPPLDA